MPGMMDTVLNIGLNDETVEGLAKLTGNPRFAWDAYRRLVEMFGTTVFNLDDELFEHPWREYKAGKGYKNDTELTTEIWKALVATFKDVVQEAQRLRLPPGRLQQLRAGHRGRVRKLERQARPRLPQGHRTSPMTWAPRSTL